MKSKGEKEDIPVWMQNSKEQQGDIRKPSSGSMQGKAGPDKCEGLHRHKVYLWNLLNNKVQFG